MSSYLTFYHTIVVRDRLVVANVNYIRTKKFARQFLYLMIKRENLGREMALSLLNHLDVLLVLLANNEGFGRNR